VVRRPKPKAAYTPLSNTNKPSLHTTLYPWCLAVGAVLELPFLRFCKIKKDKKKITYAP